MGEWIHNELYYEAFEKQGNADTDNSVDELRTLY